MTVDVIGSTPPLLQWSMLASITRNAKRLQTLAIDAENGRVGIFHTRHRNIDEHLQQFEPCLRVHIAGWENNSRVVTNVRLELITSEKNNLFAIFIFWCLVALTPNPVTSHSSNFGAKYVVLLPEERDCDRRCVLEVGSTDVSSTRSRPCSGVEVGTRSTTLWIRWVMSSTSNDANS